MSLIWEASVALASQETRAIQGVTANSGRDKQGTSKGSAGSGSAYWSYS